MNSIEQMRWAKELIEEKTKGLQKMTVGNMHDSLYIKTSDETCVGMYMSVQPNTKTQKYDCVFKAYTRTCGGYNSSKKMQQIADKYQAAANLLKELEKAKISLTGDELQDFITELKSAEEK